MKLTIPDTQEIRDGMLARSFNWSAETGYEIDDWIFEHLELEKEVVEGKRQVAVHLIPYSVVEGEIVYCAFHVENAAPTIYVSFPILQEDFILQEEQFGEGKFSFARTVFGKIIRTLDQPHIGLSLPPEQFKFPAIIDGELFYAFEVQGDNNHVTDEILKNLGNLIGRVSKEQIVDDEVEISTMSKKIAAYRAVNEGSDIEV